MIFGVTFRAKRYQSEESKHQNLDAESQVREEMHHFKRETIRISYLPIYLISTGLTDEESNCELNF